MDYLFHWVLDLPIMFSNFISWLTNPLPYLNMTPLAIFSIGGISVLLGFLLLRLVIGG